MANELKIAKCVATATNVVVYFSQALDVISSDPSQIANYAVEMLTPLTPDTFRPGPAVPIAGAYYDVINRATVLQLEALQHQGQWLLVTVNNVASAGGFIASSNVVAVQVDGAGKPGDKPGDNEQLQKILQPSYAIGMGVISNDDYAKLKNEYYAQCELSLGLIIPMILIVLGLALTPQLWLGPGMGKFLPWFLLCGAMAPISTVLFLVGAERYHKYRMELKLLILGNWQKLQDAKAKAASNGTGTKKTPPAPASPSPAITVNPLVVEVHMQTQPEKPAPTTVDGKSGGQPITAPETAGDSGQGKPGEKPNKLPNTYREFEL
jgi:hypothetical protein